MKKINSCMFVKLKFVQLMVDKNFQNIIKKVQMFQTLLTNVEENLNKDSFLEEDDLQNHETVTKLSQHPHEQKSLLTEVLKTSSEKSHQERTESQFWGQLILRPRLQDYSQPDDDQNLTDTTRKLSFLSEKVERKQMSRILTNFIEENNASNKQNKGPNIRRRQVKLRMKQESCARCEIF